MLVVGEMEEPGTWTDQEGNARASLEVQARTVRFLSPRDGAQGLAPDQGEGEEIPFSLPVCKKRGRQTGDYGLEAHMTIC